MDTRGRWRLESASDPRFNLEGYGEEVHMLSLPTEAKALLHLKVIELGKSPPDDLEYIVNRDLPPPPPLDISRLN